MQVVLEDTGVLIHGLRLSHLSNDDMRRLGRFADILDDSEKGIVVRRNRRLTVGRTVVRGVVLISPPPMATAEFLSLLYVALGGDLHRRVVLSDTGGSSEGDNTAPDAFLIGLAASLLDEAERVLRVYVSRGYIIEEQRRHVLAGRAHWTKSFGEHPAQGITCRVNRLTTDVVHNQIVYAGLVVARRLLEQTFLRERIENQVFVWRSLVTPRQVTPDDFNLAARLRNRLTEHYDSVVALSRALVLGVGLPDTFTSGDIRTVHFEFSLPGLFEQLILRLLKPLESIGLFAKFKSVDSGAFINGQGETYRDIEPDITLWLNDCPVAVIDAKFKPRYMKAQEDGRIAYKDRVTNEDLYQLFFYQSRLQTKYRMARPPYAIIVAPIVSPDAPPPAETARTVIWSDAEGEQTLLRIKPINLPELTRALKSGEGETNLLLAAAPELAMSLTHLIGANSG